MELLTGYAWGKEEIKEDGTSLGWKLRIAIKTWPYNRTQYIFNVVSSRRIDYIQVNFFLSTYLRKYVEDVVYPFRTAEQDPDEESRKVYNVGMLYIYSIFLI